MQASSTSAGHGDRRAVVLGLAVGEKALLADRPFLWNCHCSGVRRSRVACEVGDVVVVDEVGAVAAAALLELRCGFVEDSLAAAAVDAHVVRPQVRGVEDPGALLVGILEAHPLVQVVGW